MVQAQASRDAGPFAGIATKVVSDGIAASIDMLITAATTGEVPNVNS
jgi:hypothetical protein